MIGATLGFRGNESWDWHPDPPASSPNLFAVKLVTIELPPGHASERIAPFAVVCIQWARWLGDDESSWGWVKLDEDAKLALGEELEEMGNIDMWMYLVVDVGEMVNCFQLAST